MTVFDAPDPPANQKVPFQTTDKHSVRSDDPFSDRDHEIPSLL
jgi:hypothetical protein